MVLPATNCCSFWTMLTQELYLQASQAKIRNKLYYIKIDPKHLSPNHQVSFQGDSQDNGARTASLIAEPGFISGFPSQLVVPKANGIPGVKKQPEKHMFI